MQQVEKIFKYAKDKGFKHIHVLGGGWSLSDIKIWNNIQHFNTMDSIAYYNNSENFNAGTPLESIKNILEVIGND